MTGMSIGRSESALSKMTWELPADPSSWPASDDGPIATNLAEDLAEVVEARRAGYGIIGPEPRMWDWLWVLWPVSHRGWVVDRRIRTYDDGQRPWPCAEYGEIENEANLRFSRVGLPSRPMGRIWLVKHPSASTDLESCLTELAERLEQRNERLVLSPTLVASAREVLRSLFRSDSDVVW